MLNPEGRGATLVSYHIHRMLTLFGSHLQCVVYSRSHLLKTTAMALSCNAESRSSALAELLVDIPWKRVGGYSCTDCTCTSAAREHCGRAVICGVWD
jgi:hypothetical protein